ncbi:uncharacterized protein Z518_05918 [Rhinocladiella mackenziei CBS 650.93]|uniref:Ima1 N-terminal domain-containing protein n=1 Tax=Rhinocladiella mackenziei CBS 650.93 TaxID=1442369 RepID=A0A0D2IPI2_9EURO|nr:uncharacterized protein Z518_05918 [Rhinocladiella mackenziei CBS 650.93]KIX05046.1 hypothetical protein Z518_05918 [Rhinocladiella mackenziei CBS 650.93]
MPIQLRQRLDCHYCGRRSKLSKKQDRKFKCEHCLAVNFFDENGEIADVPLEEAAPEQQRFAQPVVTDPLVDDFSSQESIFCSTCLKNQHLYTYNLSQFLPDPDDPDYEKLEAELPDYKKGLEQRYPQCCARCEPKVRARLHQATYNARSDHLRRVLETSRQRRVASRWGWRSLVVSAGGLGYFTSLAVQLAWHLYGSQVSGIHLVPGGRPMDCFTWRPFRPQCLDMTEPFVGLSLNLGLLCIWWNPKWQHKLANNEERLIGLNEYYLAQFALLGLRFSAWIVMCHMPLATKVKTALHACFAGAITLIAGWSSFGIIKVKGAPSVNWHEEPAPLLSKNQFVPPALSQPQEPFPDQDQPFNVGTLSTPPRPNYQAWRPPTPPDDSAELMDWTPSQPTFQPELKQVRYKSLGPSPFHGALPALNAQGLRRQTGQNQSASKEAIGLPPGFFDRPEKSALPPRQQTSASEDIAQPKFFGHDREADTGLENIFGTVFSLQDKSLGTPHSPAVLELQPPTTGSGTEDSSGNPATRAKDSYLAIFSGISFFSILMAVVAWIFEATLVSQTSQFGYGVVLFSAGISVAHLGLLIFLHGSKGQFPCLLFLGFEASLLIVVALLREPFGELFGDLWNKLGIAVVTLLLPQEFLQMNHSSVTVQSQDEHFAPVRQVQNDQDIPRTPRPIGVQSELARRDSTESIENKTSTATTSTAWEWQDSTPHREHFEIPPLSRATPRSVGRGIEAQEQRPSRRSMFGMEGLSLSDGPPSRNSNGNGVGKGIGSGTNWDLQFSGSNIANPRARRRF